MSATLTFSWSKPTSLASCADCSFEYKYALEATSLDGLTPTPVSFGTLSVTIPGLVNGESYHYAVRTICGPVQSKWSYGTTVVCDTIPVDTPTPTPTEVVQTPTPTPTVVPDTPTPTPTAVVQTPTPTPTPIPECYYYTVTADDGTTDKNSYDFSYTNCNGDFIEIIVVNLVDRTVCAQEGTVSSESEFVDAILGSVCSEDPTPTPTPTPTVVPETNYEFLVCYDPYGTALTTYVATYAKLINGGFTGEPLYSDTIGISGSANIDAVYQYNGTTAASTSVPIIDAINRFDCDGNEINTPTPTPTPAPLYWQYDVTRSGIPGANGGYFEYIDINGDTQTVMQDTYGYVGRYCMLEGSYQNNQYSLYSFSQYAACY